MACGIPRVRKQHLPLQKNKQISRQAPVLHNNTLNALYHKIMKTFF